MSGPATDGRTARKLAVLTNAGGNTVVAVVSADISTIESQTQGSKQEQLHKNNDFLIYNGGNPPVWFNSKSALGIQSATVVSADGRVATLGRNSVMTPPVAYTFSLLSSLFMKFHLCSQVHCFGIF